MTALLPKRKDLGAQSCDQFVYCLQRTLVLGGFYSCPCFKEYLVVEVKMQVASELKLM